MKGEGHELLEARRLSASWPEPARLFEVMALQCNTSHVLVSSPFSHYAAQRHLKENGEASVGPLAEIGGFQVAALLCSEGVCDALMRMGDAGTWQLTSLTSSKRLWTSVLVPVPQEWRIAAAAWVSCAPMPCQAALLAGWDGNRIVIANLQRSGENGAWELQRRFVVRPSLDSCNDQDNVCSAESREPTYSHVRALQLSVVPGCRTLAVLRSYGSGARVDGWDLVSGASLGQWRIAGDNRYSSMCHDGSSLILSGLGGRGPVLEIASLPSAFVGCARRDGPQYGSAIA